MERKQDEQQLHAVRFAAGAAVLMACLERATLVSFFEQWRVFVFIALNLLLLAILFTSSNYHTQPSITNEVVSTDAQGEKTGTEDEAPMLQCSTLEKTKYQDVTKMLKSESKTETVNEKCKFDEGEEIEDEDDNNKASGLSKEELNEKVEAFITMFRQKYLVSEQPKIRRRNSFQLPAHNPHISVPPRISVG